MAEAVQFLFVGLGLAGVYGLAALGLVVVHRGSGVINFAHGGIALVGGSIFVELRDGLGTWPAVAVGILSGAVIGVAIELLVMRHLQRRSAVTRLIATLALLTVFQQAMVLIKGTASEFVAPILPTGQLDLGGGVTVGADRMILFGGLLVAGLLLALFLGRSRTGLAITAVAENGRAAAALGHSPRRIALISWALGGALGAAAGVFIAPLASLSPTTTTLIVIPALAAALVGRLSSLPWALVGAIVVGVGEAEATNYITAPGWANSVPFLLILAILLLRSDVIAGRSQLVERLPRIGRPARTPYAWIAFVVVALVSAPVLGDEWTSALVLTSVTAVVGMSVVVLTGYAGQISLAQYALAGVGALVAGRLVDGAGAPFLPALLAGVVVAGATGLLVGAPALRARGVTLAIATLGLGSVISAVLLSNPDYTGGPINGTVLPSPSILGLDLSAVDHPQRYLVMCLVALTLAVVVVWNLRRSPLGRRLLAIRANERAASALGVRTSSVKLYAFVVSSALAGCGGVLLAFRNTRLDYSAFNVFASNEIVLLVVLGGAGFVSGGVVGSALIAGGLVQYGVSQVSDVSDYSLLVSAAVLLLVLVLLPDGVAPAAIDRFRRRRGDEPEDPGSARPEIATPVEPGEAVSTAGSGLVVRGLRVRFGGVVAVDGVDLDVPPGQVVGLIGPNGAGKSTVIDAITGGLQRYEGSVAIGDEGLDGLSVARRSHAGLGRSFQSLELFEDMTVLDNVRVASEATERPGYARALVAPSTSPLPAAAWAAIEEFGLEDRLEDVPGDLPYARRRLLAVGRAVALQPSILLLDEPAAGLDDADRGHLSAVIERLARDRGIGVLLVEHDVAMVMRLCDRVVVLDRGRVISVGSPGEIQADPAVHAAYLGAPDTDRPAAVATTDGEA